jgi:large subunit ribosomal protein L4
MVNKTKEIKQADPKSSRLPVYDMQGDKVEEMVSPFDGRQNPAVLSQAVTMYLANLRGGVSSTKTRGEVSGGGKKPWRQKGTGRARVGSIRSPLWRHGGIVFGPHPRNFHYCLSARIRNQALLSALSEKSAKGNILVLDKIGLSSVKTRDMEKLLDNLKVEEKALMILTKYGKDIRLASRNISWLKLSLASGLNALEVAKVQKVIFVKDALSELCSRLKVT